MEQNSPKKPRVAAIGLDRSQIDSISPLCGELRSFDSLEDYLKCFSWTETEIAIFGAATGGRIVGGVHVLAIGPSKLHWEEYVTKFGDSRLMSASLSTDSKNTERVVSVSKKCPEIYEQLAANLARRLASSQNPPQTIKSWWFQGEKPSSLVVTTSDRDVALRCVRNHGEDLFVEVVEDEGALTLALPKEVDLSAWFRVFLSDVNEVDPARVPVAPPLLGSPSDWYTPLEHQLAEELVQVAAEIKELEDRQSALEADLAAEGELVDIGMRRAVWSDGEDLVAAVIDILTELGFAVRDMDEGLEPGKPKREDLRLTLADLPGWEAIAEVKGYRRGTKTNDALQIRKHRDLYNSENGRLPDQTLWISNPYRGADPSARPAPDSNIEEAATLAGAVYVSAPDLYQLWAYVAHGGMEVAAAAQLLTVATNGIWTFAKPT